VAQTFLSVLLIRTDKNVCATRPHTFGLEALDQSDPAWVSKTRPTLRG
jgi:hypothetical protein